MRFRPYRLFSLGMFFYYFGFHILSIGFALTGIAAALENVTWLMILGSAVALLARPIGYLLSASAQSMYEPPVALKSTVPVLILSVIGMFLLRFQLKINLGISFLIAMNGAILLLYILVLLYIIIRFVRYQMFKRSLHRRHRRKRKQKLSYDDDEDEIF